MPLLAALLTCDAPLPVFNYASRPLYATYELVAALQCGTIQSTLCNVIMLTSPCKSWIAPMQLYCTYTTVEDYIYICSPCIWHHWQQVISTAPWVGLSLQHGRLVLLLCSASIQATPCITNLIHLAAALRIQTIPSTDCNSITRTATHKSAAFFLLVQQCQLIDAMVV